MKVSNFDKDNEFGKKPEFWNSIYKGLFPNMVDNIFNDNKRSQLEGDADRYIYLKDKTRLRIEEKLRRKKYPDFLLEWQSNNQTNATGWITKQRNIDYLAYAFEPTKECYLLNWRQLKIAWGKYETRWRKRFNDKVTGYNGLPGTDITWETYSVAIPIPLLLTYIDDYRYIRIASEHCWITRNVKFSNNQTQDI